MNALRRAIAILADPAAEWAMIEKEVNDPAHLLRGYVALWALVPAVFGLIGSCIVGVVVPGAGLLRAPFAYGLLAAMFNYITSCAIVICLGGLIRVLAPMFGGQRDFNGAFQLAVYSYTPVWLTGVFLLAPGLRFLGLIGLYGAYIFWIGTPSLAKLAVHKVRVFTAILVVCAGTLIFITGVLQHTLFGAVGR